MSAKAVQPVAGRVVAVTAAARGIGAADRGDAHATRRARGDRLARGAGKQRDDAGGVETELAAGTSHGKGRRLRPEEVAAAVVAALERPRFEVFVPRSIAGWSRVMAVAPQPGRDTSSTGR